MAKSSFLTAHGYENSHFLAVDRNWNRRTVLQGNAEMSFDQQNNHGRQYSTRHGNGQYDQP